MVPPKNIGIVRTDGLGDMILTLPMVQPLRRRFPDARIVMFANSVTEDLLNAADCVDEIVYTDRAENAFVNGLRGNLIDAVFFPRPRLSEAWAAFKLAIPTRIGSSYRLYSPLFSHRVADHRSTAQFHESEYNVRMISSTYGGLTDQVNLARLNPRELSAQTSAVLPEKFIVVHPGSKGSSRDWPTENFSALVRNIVHRFGVQVVLTGVESEKPLHQEILKSNPSVISLCGMLSLHELITVISRACLFVSNSTGTLHIAASLDVPIVTFFPTTPALSAKRWGPVSERAIVLESDAADDMKTISVNAATAAVQQQLNTT